MIQLSIIVPVYNVEPYIRACMESIFMQGLDETCFVEKYGKYGLASKEG